MRTPVVELDAAVSLAMAGKLDDGPRWLNELERRDVLGDHHVLALANAEFLLRAGHRKQAERYLRRARRLATARSRTRSQRLSWAARPQAPERLKVNRLATGSTKKTATRACCSRRMASRSLVEQLPS
jgi:hypothetical protein